jgi:hypothetical protein
MGLRLHNLCNSMTGKAKTGHGNRESTLYDNAGGSADRTHRIHHFWGTDAQLQSPPELAVRAVNSRGYNRCSQDNQDNFRDSRGVSTSRLAHHFCSLGSRCGSQTRSALPCSHRRAVRAATAAWSRSSAAKPLGLLAAYSPILGT